MAAADTVAEPVVEVENLGGIDHTRVDLASGVNVLAGRNATNRTSFLRAVMGSLGSDDVAVKASADRGSVTLTLGDETYTRTFERGAGAVDGSPYLADSELADLFAFLLEDNEARRAVARGDDLREIIMRPVDVASIQAEIHHLQSRRDGIDDTLDELDDLEARLPSLEERRTQLSGEIEEYRERLGDLEAELADAEERPETDDEFEDALADLRDARSDLDDVRETLDIERESLDALRAEKRELEAELADLPAPADDAESLADRIDRLRERKRVYDSTISRLDSIVQFNEEMLDGDAPLAGLTDETGDAGSDSVTDQLLDDDRTITCWTCGAEVTRSDVEAELDALREVRKENFRERTDIEEELADLTDRQERLESVRDERGDLEARLDRTTSEIERRTARADDLEDEVADLEAEIERLEDAVEELDSGTGSQDDEFLDRHREANRIEFELGRLESERREVADEIQEIEDRLAERDRLRDERADVADRLEECRTRIERLETEAVDQFNDHMQEVLDILGYENIARIWIERRGAQDDRPEFDLHVTRTAESGAVYDDTVDHLSESEREITGLVFALAGYLAHDAYETVPFVLLDSLEAIDSARIARLVDYFREYAPYLVVALLPEDAAALDDDYHRVTEI